MPVEQTLVVTFEQIYQVEIAPNIRQYSNIWKRFGGDWLEEVSGGVCDDLTSREHTDMYDYKRFDELSAADQYAFVQWWIRGIQTLFEEYGKAIRRKAELITEKEMKQVICFACNNSICKAFHQVEFIKKLGFCIDCNGLLKDPEE
jgi:hypothetical protein